MKRSLLTSIACLVLLTALVMACDQTPAPTSSPTPEPTQGLTPHPSTLSSQPPPSSMPAPITFTLSTSVSPEGTGSVSPSSGEYQQGSTIIINATPSTDYDFTYWSGDVGAVANVNAASTTITINDDYTITANFNQYTYTLTTKSTRGGSITTPGEGIYTYSAGTSVNIVATADTGYSFTHWSDDVSTANGVRAASTTITMVTFTNITMDSDKTVVAHFADVAPPVISEVEVTDVSDTSVTITWATDEPATSQVEYGKTTGYELQSSPNEKLVTSHNVALHDLEPSTAYHFMVKSKDANENEAKSKDYTFTTWRGPTKVGGVLSKGTGRNRYEIIWTAYESPYEITETIQIPEDITLTIEPGVIVNKPTSGDMFLLMGTINAQGTEKKPIVFDGGGNSTIIGTYGDQATGDFEYCVFQNGSRLWDGSGAFNLRHSQIVGLTPGSRSAYSGAIIESHPAGGEINIEYNKFVNTGGIYLLPDSEYGISIEYNLFQGMLSPLCSTGALLLSPELFGYPKAIIVKYNSFIEIEGTVLLLELRIMSGLSYSYPISATQNYWGTTDKDVIDLKIHDGNDDIRIGSTIEYRPILKSPHPDTPSPD